MKEKLRAPLSVEIGAEKLVAAPAGLHGGRDGRGGRLVPRRARAPRGAREGRGVRGARGACSAAARASGARLVARFTSARSPALESTIGVCVVLSGTAARALRRCGGGRGGSSDAQTRARGALGSRVARGARARRALLFYRPAGATITAPAGQYEKRKIRDPHVVASHWSRMMAALLWRRRALHLPGAWQRVTPCVTVADAAEIGALGRERCVGMVCGWASRAEASRR